MFNYKLSDYIILTYNLIHITAHKSIQKFYRKIYRKS